MKKANPFKRIILIFGILLLSIIVAAVAIPFLFKDKIIAKVKEEVNKNVNAKVDFKDVDLTLLSSFPHLNLNLTDLSVKGVNLFEDYPLFSTKKIALTLDVMGVIRGANPLPIKHISLDEPNINVLVLKSGHANYDIAKPSTEKKEDTPSNFVLKLDGYDVKNGHLIYQDETMGLKTELSQLNHEGSGNFTADVYDLTTKTTADKFSMTYGGITYLKDAYAKANVTVNADMKNMKFTLKDNEVTLNELLAKAEGWVAMPKDDIDMDLRFNVPQNNFKNLLSILPSAYTKDYANVKADGKFDLNGAVKGVYNSLQKKLPAFNINLNVDNANVKYPTLPLGITNINTKMAIKSPSSNFNDMTVNIPMFKFQVGSNPFDGYFNLKTPVSDPDIDTKMNGVLNLAELAKAFPMESVSNLNGIITANVLAKTRMSYIDQKQYDKVNMDGKLRIEAMNVQAKGQPSVKINDLQMNFTPNYVGVDNFDALLGKSDIKAKGTVDNILAYFSPERTMKGNVTVRSNFFDANEWISQSTEPAKPAAPTTNATTAAGATAKPFDRFDFALDGQFNQINYDKYVLKNVIAKGHTTPNELKTENFAMNIGNSDIRGNGTITNMFNYLFDNGTLGGNLNIASNMMDLNQFMTNAPSATSAPTTSTTPAASGVILVPKNVDIELHADMKKILYTNMELNNLKGKLAIAKEEIRIVDGNVNTLGGAMTLNGAYNTKNTEKPKFDFKYGISKLDFPSAFKYLNTVQMLAPIAQYIEGKFNSDLAISGELTKDMTPNFATLNAAGFIQTINSLIKNFKPLEEIGNKLNVAMLKSMELKNSQNWFEIVEGKVVVKPFDINLKEGVVLSPSGTHAYNQDMNYDIKTKLPRKLLQKNSVTATADAGLNFISKEATKLGLNVQQGENINLAINMTGNIKNPKINIKFLSMDGQSSVTDVVKANIEQAKQKAIDSLRNIANQQVEKAKEKGKEVAQKVADSLQRVVNKQVEDVTKKAKDEITKKANEQLGEKAGELGKKAEDALGGKAKEGVDEVKKRLDTWNPFKKKKEDQTAPANSEGNQKKEE